MTLLNKNKRGRQPIFQTWEDFESALLHEYSFTPAVSFLASEAEIRAAYQTHRKPRMVNLDTQTKVCSKCGVAHPWSDFRNSWTRPDLRFPICKHCHAIWEYKSKKQPECLSERTELKAYWASPEYAELRAKPRPPQAKGSLLNPSDHTKTCSKCQRTLPHHMFLKDSKEMTRDLLISQCRDCGNRNNYPRP